jgi:uncharacterized protein (DUF1800 family)
MDTRSQIAWLHRRLGFGLRPGELDRLTALGPEAALTELLGPDAAGVPPAPDPWADVDLSRFDKADSGRRRYARAIVGAWLTAMATTPRPFEEWMRWFWHGHFVSTLRVVRDPRLMVQQLRLFGELGLGDFRTLLRAVTVDPAMLVYLDGRTSARGAVNENYGREVLELFALGIGNYDEADVRAGATALTGWVVRPDPVTGGRAEFVARRHDDTAQQYLGRAGVHDLDTVVDAIVVHPACARHITSRLVRAILGPDVEAGVIDDLAAGFAASGLELHPLVEAIARAGTGGASSPFLLAPVPWTVGSIRATAADPAAALSGAAGAALAAAGQVPMDAPNVAGWPSTRAWLSSSATVARVGAASAIATLTPARGTVRRAAATGDVAGLADALGRPEGFEDVTADAIVGLTRTDPTGVGGVALALAAPEVVVA